jgi:hypothetical protein
MRPLPFVGPLWCDQSPKSSADFADSAFDQVLSAIDLTPRTLRSPRKSKLHPYDFPPPLPFCKTKSLHWQCMNLPTQPNLKLVNDPSYRENYANSVQMRVNIWDFFLVFGTLQQQSETQVEIRNFEGIYLSPQQAKALLGLLQQNIAGYESAFGEIKLDPRMTAPGQVN